MVTVVKTWAASKDRDRERVPALRGRTGGLPKNVHIWSKLTPPTSRALSPPVLALGNQAFAVFFLKSGIAIANNIANNFDPAGQLSVRIREHIFLYRRQTHGNH